MPLRHDGSGGTRSAWPLASTPAERPFHPTVLDAASGRDIFLRSERCASAELSAIALVVLLGEIVVLIEEATGVNPFVELTRA